MGERPPVVTLRASGPLACFSRPEFSVERTSYPWITPSAARALFEAVAWKPRIRYEVREIRVLRPIRFLSLYRNEIGVKVPSKGLNGESRILTDDVRQQRNTVALTDVAYEIQAEIRLDSRVAASGPDDNHGKYVGIFQRRLAAGQHFHQPYLGQREFAADIRPAEPGEQPIQDDLDHGLMLYDFDFPERADDYREWRPAERPRPLYFEARMRQGVILVPGRGQVVGARP